MPDSGAELCRCGHARNAHEHYRAGTDCSLCEPGGCAGYEKAGGLQDKISDVVTRLTGKQPN